MAKTQHRPRSRANREGSTYRRASDGLWVSTTYDGNGKRRPVYGKTRAEATSKRKILEREIADAAPITTGHGVKTSAYLRQWLDMTLPQRVAAGRLSERADGRRSALRAAARR